MIDKLEVRVPCDTPYHPEFSRLYSELRYEPKTDPFRRSRHYELIADLRPYGHGAILHLHCRWGKHGNHKVELLDTGRMTLAKMVNEIERMFDINAERLPIMRLDLAADVYGVTVSWFQNRIKAEYKRCLANFGEFLEMGKDQIQTLYYGKRPNLYRIYDKVAECKYQHRQLTRKLASDVASPSLEEVFGVRENSVITRVERQMGGGKIPEQLQSVGDLRKCPDFEPFNRLPVIDGGTPDPNPHDYGFMTFCTGMYLRQKAEQDGMHSMLKFISRTSGRNTRWALTKFADFLPVEHEEKWLNTDHLNELYRRSVMQQLNGYVIDSARGPSIRLLPDEVPETNQRVFQAAGKNRGPETAREPLPGTTAGDCQEGGGDPLGTSR